MREDFEKDAHVAENQPQKIGAVHCMSEEELRRQNFVVNPVVKVTIINFVHGIIKPVNSENLLGVEGASKRV